MGCTNLTDSDHLMIYGVYQEEVKATRQCVRMVRNFRQCDNDRLLMNVEQAPWNILDTFDSIDGKWDCRKSLFLSIVDDHAPLRKVRVKADAYPWMTDEVRCLARARNYYRKKFMKPKNQCYWECFKNLRKKVKEQLVEGLQSFVL